MRDVDLMSAEVADAKRDGNLACIVDAGHPDMGRDINFIRQVSMKSGVPIVAGGGFYSQPFYPREISTMSEEQIVSALIKQADDDVLGVFGEIGSWDEITADERKVFRARWQGARCDEHSDLHAHGDSREIGARTARHPRRRRRQTEHVVIGHLGISSTRASTCKADLQAGRIRRVRSTGAATAMRSGCRW
jgi:phosphotriesterase-related protein